YDMEYDNPESYFLHYLPEVKDLQEHPFVIYYKNSEVVKVTSGLQTKTQITKILDKEFADNVDPKSNSTNIKKQVICKQH
ncbi:MAG TPA: hypothetical protein DCL77_03230, partial [Prolixibacteraceae bacterium]|nr:hypothetical protein [Prolixibacteraceae bacterium]